MPGRSSSWKRVTQAKNSEQRIWCELDCKILFEILEIIFWWWCGFSVWELLTNQNALRTAPSRGHNTAPKTSEIYFLFQKNIFWIKLWNQQKSGIQYTDVALRSFKTLKERNKQRIIIQITPEVIRVVSAKDRTLLFDQAVDKISFCAPSNTYPDAFR